MGKMFSTPENKPLLGLVDGARTGKIVLPQFQRNFVWARDDINNLLVSFLENHYIGSFLFLDVDKENIPFDFRLIEGIEFPLSHAKPEHMVLDGQQRLTAFNYALYAPNIPVKSSKFAFRFYLDLNKAAEEDWENAVSNDYAEKTGKKLTREYQFEHKLIPFTELENFESWQNEYEKWLVNKNKDEYLEQYFPKFKPAWDRMKMHLLTFVVPVISLSKIQAMDETGLADICTIFERLNSTGVKLSVYDLLTARMYKYRVDLHKLWEQSLPECPALNQLSGGEPDEYGVYLLRTIAMLRGVEVRNRVLINLKPEHFEQDWKTAVRYFEKALVRMQSVAADGFGAFDPEWIPYITMASTLAMMLYIIETKKLGHQAYKRMQQWYWAAVFMERYAGTVESTLQKDYQDFLKACEDVHFEPEAIREARTAIIENPAFSLEKVNRKNSLYRSIMCLLALNGAKDFSADDGITFHDLDDHHIFPQAYLKSMGIKDEMINSILNRTLITERTNKEISKSQPSKYILRMIPSGQKEAILRSHFISEEAVKELEADHFENFIALRQKEILRIMKDKIIN